MTTNCSFEFLGTIAGNQTYLEENQEKIYTRIYQPFEASDNLRRRISQAGHAKLGTGYKDIGEEYSYTPRWHERNFLTDMQGGGFFKTVHTFENTSQDRSLNCFAYALGTFGNKLENLAKEDMQTIQESVALTIDQSVKKYFTNVTTIPEDGDLAVYSIPPGEIMRTPGGLKVSGTTHAGIYRKSEPNWNSPKGGSIESKWGWFGNPYVFQHDVFFVPDFYGNVVKFYRLNTPSQLEDH